MNGFNISNPITVAVLPMSGPITRQLPTRRRRLSPMQTANVNIPMDFADDIVENTETFVVMLSSSDSGVTVDSSSNTTINVEDNDGEYRTANY